jgi:ASC-1-like (ASCH) protein
MAGGKTYERTIRDHVIDWIVNGGKNLDVRVGYPNIKAIAVGDTLILQSPKRDITVEVEAIRRYSSLDKMCHQEDVAHIAPGMSPEQIIWELDKLFGDKVRFGIFVFQIKLIGGRATGK